MGIPVRVTWNWFVFGLGVQLHGPLGRIVIVVAWLTLSVQIGSGIESDAWSRVFSEE